MRNLEDISAKKRRTKQHFASENKSTGILCMLKDEKKLFLQKRKKNTSVVNKVEKYFGRDKTRMSEKGIKKYSNFDI